MGKRQDIRRVEESDDENRFLFYGRRSYQRYVILKLDLKRDFSAVETATAAVPARPNFSLKRCSHGRVSSPLSAGGSATTNAASLPAESRRRRKRRSWNWMGRCNRHLIIRYKFRQFRKRMERAFKPSPKPFFEITCNPREGGFPQEFAMAASGSKLYLFGGYSWVAEDRFYRKCKFLPRDVHYIDATADFGVMVKMSSQMNSGKRTPLAWSVGEKIYVLPTVFSFGEVPGYFECFDPKSGSWTILPSPPFVDDKSQFTVPSDSSRKCPLLLLVNNNILLGSNLVISTQEGKLYSFDTSQHSLGWRPVSLSFGSSELKFLPFDPLSAVPLGEGVIYCYVDSRSFPAPYFGHPYFGTVVGGGHAEKSFLKSLDIGYGDSYVCRFEYDAHDPQRLHLSIKPVRGIAGMIKCGEYMSYGGSMVDVAGFGDGLVMFVKTGYFRCSNQQSSSLNVFRIEEGDGEYVASNISTALLQLCAPSYFSSFIMKDVAFLPSSFSAVSYAIN